MTNRIFGLLIVLSLAACTTEMEDDDVGEVSQELVICVPPTIDLTWLHTEWQETVGAPCTQALVKVDADTGSTDLDYWFRVKPFWVEFDWQAYDIPGCLKTSLHVKVEALTAEGWTVVRDYLRYATWNGSSCNMPPAFQTYQDPSDDQLYGIDRYYRVSATALFAGEQTSVVVRAHEI